MPYGVDVERWNELSWQDRCRLVAEDIGCPIPEVEWGQFEAYCRGRWASFGPDRESIEIYLKWAKEK